MRVISFRSLVVAVVAVIVVCAAAPAAAWSSYIDDMPNTEKAGGCDLCHGGSGLTAFGTQAKEATTWGVSWSRLFCQDADGDGQTNGQELGDPCGHWRRGDEPERTDDLSSPNDADATATDPGVGCDADERAPVNCDETNIDDIGDDGCSAARLGAGSPLTALALLLAAARPRRRRAPL